MYSKNAPFRYDFVGSFLRPANLKAAREGFENGKISADELKAVEDKEIERLINKQKELGYHVITDGEFRRATWHLDFMWGFDGVAHEKTKTGLPFHGEDAMIDDTYLCGKVGLSKVHPFVEHFKFVKQFEDDNTVARQTIPAPAQLYAELFREDNGKATRAVYPDDDALLADIAAHRDAFITAMDDDLNTADGISAVFELVYDINTRILDKTVSPAVCQAAADLFDELCGVLGILYNRKSNDVDAEIESLIAQRQEARKNKDFATADRIRDELKERGILLKDTPQGVTWTKA